MDAGGGWLIFKLPPSELAVHPAEEPQAGRQELYLMCEDIEGTMAELTGKGVRFTRPLTENEKIGMILCSPGRINETGVRPPSAGFRSAGAASL